MRFIRRPNERLYTLQTPRVKVGCIFRAEKFRSDGTITYRGPRFHNVILDVGLDGMADRSVNGLTDDCNVGTGSSEPATNQSGLDSYLAVAGYSDKIDTAGTTQETDPAYVSSWTKWEFGIGSCTGNLTEVGLSDSANSGYFNRQLFRDNNGDPVTITVGSDEGLRVDAEVFVYSPLNKDETVPGSFLLNEYDSIDYTLEMSTGILRDLIRHSHGAAGLGLSSDYSGWALDKTYESGDSEISRESYSAGSFERIHSCVIPPGDFAGTLRRIATRYTSWYGDALFHFRLDTSFDIEDDEETTIEWKSSWGRYDEYVS